MFANPKMQLGLLAAMQALMLINNVTLISVSGLAGFMLAENKLLATLPVTAYLLGGAVWSMPAAAFMRRFGRRAGYTVGSGVAMLGALAGWQAMAHQNLALLCLATFVMGLYNAFGASLRFAAADVADSWRPELRARAMSLVLTGGIAGGIIGPEVAKWSRGWLDQKFAGSYLTLVGFALLSMLLAQTLRIPRAPQGPSAGPVRPLSEILAQPQCWIAILCAAMGYGVMNLLMVATPLAMEVCRMPWSSTALVMEWHVIGMFLPGLFSGMLIARFGALPVIATGCLLLFGCVAIAVSGVELMNFVSALILLGVGWNFLYTGGSTMLTACYRPQEKNKVQGFMDLCVFATMITSSASSGALIHVNGWALLNLLSLPFILLALAGVVWLGMKSSWSIGRVATAR